MYHARTNAKLSCLNESCLQHSWTCNSHTKVNRPLLDAHYKGIHRRHQWTPNQRRTAYPPAVSLSPTTQTNTVPEIIDSTLIGLQHSAHLPKFTHLLKNKLDTCEEKLHAGDPHITIAVLGDTLATLTCNLSHMETFDLYDTSNLSNNGVTSSEPSCQKDC